MRVDVKGGIKSKVGESKDTNGGQSQASLRPVRTSGGGTPSPNGFSLLTFR